jgi:large subunit ribosomal protein L10
MDNPRPEKVAVVDEVRQQFEQSNAAILTDYRGLKVKDLAGLRRSLRSNGGEYKIYKNTLVRLAAKQSGLGALEEMLVGPTGITFIEGDAAAVAKVLRDYSRTNPLLLIKGGVLGEMIIGPQETAALAELPSREVLLAQLAGAMAAPMQQFAALLKAVPQNLAYGLAALRDKKAAEEAEPAEAAAAAPEASAPAASSSESAGPGATDEVPSGTASAPADASAPGATDAAAPAPSHSESDPPAAEAEPSDLESNPTAE